MNASASDHWKTRISINDKVQGGKPVIAGTRVPVEVVLGALAGGTILERVAQAYGITEQDIRAALAYATEMLKLERVYALPG